VTFKSVYAATKTLVIADYWVYLVRGERGLSKNFSSVLCKSHGWQRRQVGSSTPQNSLPVVLPLVFTSAHTLAYRIQKT